MSTHAILSPSSAARWSRCPGSVSANLNIPDKPNIYAKEGIQAHEIAEACLRNNIYPSEYDNNNITSEMAENITTYVDYVRAISGRQEYEVQVNFENWVLGGYGTVDALVIDENEATIHTIDLKFGKGVQIFAFDNPQLKLYALGAYSEVEMLHPISRIVLHIVQPRLDHIDTWESTPEELLAWGEWIRERAELALSPDAPRIPGDVQCKWCKTQGTCEALYNHTTEVLGVDFDDLAEASTGKMTEEQLGRVLDNAHLIRGWIQAVEDHVYDILAGGQDFSGYKLVEGRSNRKWADEQQAEEVLINEIGDDAWEKKLLSPAKAEKALGKKKGQVKDLIIKPAGKPTLVPESDKRPSLKDQTISQFETL